ncbi:MAG: DUF1629 domain-containing protein [Clostridiaceae bacterium]
MDYYRLVYSKNEKDSLPKEMSPLVINSYELNGFDLRDFWKGKKIENLNSNIELSYNRGEVILDYIPNNLSWLIFSEKVVNILKEIEANIEIFPVQILKDDKKNKFLAYVVNILDNIPVMNWDKSDYVAWDGDSKAIKAIRNLIINLDSIPDNVDIFRLDESRNFIIVSDRLKTKLVDNSLSGLGFWQLGNA